MLASVKQFVAQVLGTGASGGPPPSPAMLNTEEVRLICQPPFKTDNPEVVFAVVTGLVKDGLRLGTNQTGIRPAPLNTRACGHGHRRYPIRGARIFMYEDEVRRVLTDLTNSTPAGTDPNGVIPIGRRQHAVSRLSHVAT